MREIKRLFDLPPREFEVGIERELVFMAKGRGGEVYNFNISPQVCEFLNGPDFQDGELKALFQQGWQVKPEYSKALIEIVSPPQKRSQVAGISVGANQIRRFLNKLVFQLAKDWYPHLSDFRFFTQSRGTSSTDQYLTPEGSIHSDPENILENVLESYLNFVRQMADFKMSIAGYTETNIGIYNHLNSTHITFHPEYTHDPVSNSDKYFRFLMELNHLLHLFKPCDQGNRRLKREGKIYETDGNLRDLFLAALNGYLYHGFIDSEYRAQSTSHEAEVDNLETYLEQLRCLPGVESSPETSPDALFKKWNSLNFRPRFINDAIPAIEIRAFGSSIFLDKIQDLIFLIASLDRNY